MTEPAGHAGGAHASALLFRRRELLDTARSHVLAYDAPMGRLFSLVLAVVVGLPMQAPDLAPSGTLRAAFIGDNPVQGRVDPQTGAVTGLAADLVRELARQLGVPYAIVPLPNPGAVLEAVETNKADLGFLAYEADRAEQVAFSEPYVLSPGAYLVRADSSIRSSAEVDRAG